MEFITQFTPQQDAELQSVLKLAQLCEYDSGHAHQVTRLALRIFDGLKDLHKLNQNERFLLQCACILHDIGWIEGQKSHHKASLDIILNAPSLALDNKERMIIGSIARYHRKALPKADHDHFATLDSDEKKIVTKLAAILRVADGLDHSHNTHVRDLSCKVTHDKVILRCIAPMPYLDEERYAIFKGDLFVKTFDRAVEIEWRVFP
jgi:exopolyphosphatase/pppGpp-phosphohydrolase